MRQCQQNANTIHSSKKLFSSTGSLLILTNRTLLSVWKWKWGWGQTESSLANEEIEKSRNEFKLLPSSTHLNWESGCELTIWHWCVFQSVHIPHSGSKRGAFEDFLSFDKCYPFHSPFLTPVPSVHQPIALTPRWEFTPLEKDACVIVTKSWCLAGQLHTQKSLR